MLAWAGQVATYLSQWMKLVVVHWQGRLAWVMAVASLYMAEAELLAELELAVRLVVVLVQVLQEVQSRGRRGWMRKIGVDHNKQYNHQGLHIYKPSCVVHSLAIEWPTWAAIPFNLLPGCRSLTSRKIQTM